MSGWTEREYGAIKIKHHSTSSLIENDNNQRRRS